MSGLFLPPELAARLRAMRAEQAAVRTAEAMTGKWDVRELAALRRLAWDLFRDHGVIEFRPSNPGIAYLGRAHQRQQSKDAHRYRKARWMFSGANIAEISRQVKLWRQHRA